MKERVNVYFPPELLRQLIDLSGRKRVSRSSIVEAAVASFFSPDGSERMEAALGRRLDRLSRQVQRLERDLTIATETLALFVRFWLTVTPPLPADAQVSAQAKGRERFEDFVEVLGRRIGRGKSFLQDVGIEGVMTSDVVAAETKSRDANGAPTGPTSAHQTDDPPE